jgi:hypothetical protein
MNSSVSRHKSAIGRYRFTAKKLNLLARSCTEKLLKNCVLGSVEIEARARMKGEARRTLDR